ncbi:tripartite tricarboxylate transporter permease [Campylobacter blaseri]|nr:tripartite tricarboxylate transporter permease [Campylobacter blaseri]
MIPIITGFGFGIISGLIPGIHTNTICAILLSLFFTTALNDVNVLYIATFIVSAAMTHTFFDIFPSLFLGIPGDEVYALLPGQKMVKRGKGLEALNISISGSLQGFIYSFILCISLFLIIVYYNDKALIRFENIIKENMFLILLTISIFLILTDKNKIFSFFVFIFSGILGVLTLGSPNVPNPNLSAFNGIFPALTGLFGLSGLVLALFARTSPICKQDKNIKLNVITKPRSSLLGSIGGIITGFLPGLGSANAATCMLLIEDFLNKKNINKSESEKEYIASTSAINTSDAVFSIMTIYLIGKSRSGASVAIEQIIPNILINHAMIMLSSMGIAALLSFWLIHKLKYKIIEFFSNIFYKPLTFCIIFFLIFVVYFTTSLWGLFILAISTLLGIMPYIFNVRKGQMMGFFILPTILFFSGYQENIVSYLNLEAKIKIYPELTLYNIIIIFFSAIFLAIFLYRILKRKAIEK